jgi:hypothetical protein
MEKKLLEGCLEFEKLQIHTVFYTAYSARSSVSCTTVYLNCDYPFFGDYCDSQCTLRGRYSDDVAWRSCMISIWVRCMVGGTGQNVLTYPVLISH